MSTILLDADGFQVASWDVPLPWTPDDESSPSERLRHRARLGRRFRPALSRGSCLVGAGMRPRRNGLGLKPESFEPTDADWDEMAR